MSYNGAIFLAARDADDFMSEEATFKYQLHSARLVAGKLYITYCCDDPNIEHSIPKVVSIGGKVPKWSAIPDSVMDEYLNGDSIMEISNRNSTSFNYVREKLISLGVSLRRPGNRHGENSPVSKLKDADVVHILELDKEGKSHSEIGKQFSVTRERIRQICQAHGLPTRREIQSEIGVDKLKAKIIAKEEKERALDKFLSEIATAYREGVPLSEIAGAFGYTSSPQNGNRLIKMVRRKRPNLLGGFRRQKRTLPKETACAKQP